MVFVRGMGVGGLGSIVLAALAEAVWSELVVVDLVECTIDCMVICAVDTCKVVCARDARTVVCVLDDGSVVCAHHDPLFLFFFLLLEVDFIVIHGTDDVSAVEGDMI
jgi:hypothetical protein